MSIKINKRKDLEFYLEVDFILKLNIKVFQFEHFILP